MAFWNKSTKKSISTTDSDFFRALGSEWSPTNIRNSDRPKMLEYYLTVPELFAVISLKAQLFSKMKLNLVSDITGNPAPLTNRLQRLLLNPNFHQGQKEFLTQTKVFRELYGNEYLYGYKGIGSKLPNQVNSLDPARLVIDTNYEKNTKPIFQQTTLEPFNYIYTEDNKGIEIPNEDVVHINNAVVQDSQSKDSYTGLSRIVALTNILDNIKGAYEGRGMLIHNRGALGILSNASKDGTGAAGFMDKGDKDQLQKDLSKYGLKKSQWTTIVTNLSLEWQQMGTSTKDLMLFEEIEEDFQTIIGAYGLKRELFPNTKGATFENQKQAEKSAYTNTIIPEAIEWTSALNNYFATEKTGYHIVADFTHLDVFSEDLKNKGIALKNYIGALDIAFHSGALTLQQYKEEINNIL